MWVKCHLLLQVVANVFLFYEEENDDIAIDVYDGSTWIGETVLETGTYDTVRSKWSQYNNTEGSSVIDYIFSDGTDLFWHEITFTGGGGGSGALTAANDFVLGGAGNVTVNVSTNDVGIDVEGNVTIGASDTLVCFRYRKLYCCRRLDEQRNIYAYIWNGDV